MTLENIQKRNFQLSILEAKEKLGELTEEQKAQLESLRESEQLRHAGVSAGALIEPTVYGEGISGTPESDRLQNLKLEHKRATRQDKRSSRGGSTG
ncbi:MAG: hypothetical protein ABSC49_04085 [Candidatus Microgenomates bacterium]|jgi:hypothetical protein